ncbi:hypothetical protein [Methanobrevibacter sp.]|uniref:hypothetical protein n=1 Tax=Methanobrevibacter sp. TaxID=66852 RepID=UPI00388DF2DE
MLDEKGNFFIIDAVLAVILLLCVFLVFNSAISIPDSSYSGEIRESKNAQDIMEILSGKVDYDDGTFIREISEILEENKNSKESINEVSKLSKDKFKSFNLVNYRFSETNVLNDKVLSGSGDYSGAEDVSSATRSYGDYYYTLSTW